jgi:hypothetical protein
MNETSIVDRFLAELERGLIGGRRWQADTLAEIRSHLLDALEHTGMDLDAERKIVDQFGDPGALAQDLSEIERSFRRIDRRLTWVGCCMLSAIAATTLLAVRTADRKDEPRPLVATRVIGTIVAVAPDVATVRLARGAGSYVLSNR